MGELGAHMVVSRRAVSPARRTRSDTTSNTLPNRVWGTSWVKQRDAHALLKYDLASIGLYLAGNEPHDRGLARAVPAHKTDPLAPVDGEIDPFEQQRPAEA